MLPCRALPVPFCRHGFLPPPLFSARVLTHAVPFKNEIPVNDSTVINFT